MPDITREDAITLLGRIAGLAEASGPRDGGHAETLQAMRDELQAALAHPVREALEDVLAIVNGTGPDSYAVMAAGLRAGDKLKALASLRG